MAEALVEELERNPGLRQRLARAIAPDVVAGIALSPELRGALIQGLVREVATKGDVERLRESLEAPRREVTVRVEEISSRLGNLERWPLATSVRIWSFIMLAMFGRCS